MRGGVNFDGDGNNIGLNLRWQTAQNDMICHIFCRFMNALYVYTKYIIYYVELDMPCFFRRGHMRRIEKKSIATNWNITVCISFGDCSLLTGAA